MFDHVTRLLHWCLFLNLLIETLNLCSKILNLSTTYSRRRYTARHISSTQSAVLSQEYPIPGWTGVPHPWMGGTPSLARVAPPRCEHTENITFPILRMRTETQMFYPLLWKWIKNAKAFISYWSNLVTHYIENYVTYFRLFTEFFPFTYCFHCSFVCNIPKEKVHSSDTLQV